MRRVLMLCCRRSLVRRGHPRPDARPGACAAAAAGHGHPRWPAARSRRGRRADQPDHPGGGDAHSGSWREPRDSARRAGDRSLEAHRDARPGRRAQPSGADLQAGAGEQRLLLHVRPGVDGTSRHSGGVERHPDARVRLHHRPRHGEQRQLRRHGAASGDRAGLDSGADDHQSGNHHRRHGRAVLSDAGNGEGPQHRLSRIPRR